MQAASYCKGHHLQLPVLQPPTHVLTPQHASLASQQPQTVCVHQPSPVTVRNVLRVQAAGSFGSDTASKRMRKPEWVRMLEDDAEAGDEDAARVVEGTDGDVDKIREKIRAELERREKSELEGQGVEEPPKVVFREVNPFALWIWMEFYIAPNTQAQQSLDSLIQAWYLVGKMGGFSASNLQITQNGDMDLSYLKYDSKALQESPMSTLQSASPVEYQGLWARTKVDIGTCDELAVDVLLNMLAGYSLEMCGIRKVYIGGENKDWAVPQEDPDEFMPEVGIDPMRLPEGLDEELELLDDVQAMDMLKQDEERLNQMARLSRRSSKPTSSSSVPGVNSSSRSARLRKLPKFPSEPDDFDEFDLDSNDWMDGDYYDDDSDNKQSPSQSAAEATKRAWGSGWANKPGPRQR